MTPVGRRRVWFGLFVAVVFLLGVATGAGAARLLRFGPPFGRRPPPPPSPAAIAERLTRELSLSPEQRTTLEGVLRQGSERLERFHAETGDAYGKLRRELDADIERVLTPDQQTKFRAMRPPPGRGPGPGPGRGPGPGPGPRRPPDDDRPPPPPPPR
jgi:hypothetical protein